MSKPRLLDLFCGAGGAAMGYHRAGFEVVGVDIKPQPHYPFEFHQGDALAWLEQVVMDRQHPEWLLERFDAIHASPPCQHYSVTHAVHADRIYPDLIDPVRQLLVATGIPYVIENVPNAPLVDPVVLCGEMFGLGVIRHRLFEANWPLDQPAHVVHRDGGTTAVGCSKRPGDAYMTIAGHWSGIANGRDAMGIDWMSRDELSQAIPPAYTEWIGTHLMNALKAADPSAPVPEETKP